MCRRPPRTKRTDTLFPKRRSSDLRNRPVGTHPGLGLPPERQGRRRALLRRRHGRGREQRERPGRPRRVAPARRLHGRPGLAGAVERSEEHTSELQSLMRISYAVFCLKKKKKIAFITISIHT